jgi:hypothetical protein
MDAPPSAVTTPHPRRLRPKAGRNYEGGPLGSMWSRSSAMPLPHDEVGGFVAEDFESPPWTGRTDFDNALSWQESGNCSRKSPIRSYAQLGHRRVAPAAR